MNSNASLKVRAQFGTMRDYFAAVSKEVHRRYADDLHVPDASNLAHHMGIRNTKNLKRKGRKDWILLISNFLCARVCWAFLFTFLFLFFLISFSFLSFFLLIIKRPQARKHPGSRRRLFLVCRQEGQLLVRVLHLAALLQAHGSRAGSSLARIGNPLHVGRSCGARGQPADRAGCRQ